MLRGAGNGARATEKSLLPIVLLVKTPTRANASRSGKRSESNWKKSSAYCLVGENTNKGFGNILANHQQGRDGWWMFAAMSPPQADSFDWSSRPRPTRKEQSRIIRDWSASGGKRCRCASKKNSLNELLQHEFVEEAYEFGHRDLLGTAVEAFVVEFFGGHKAF